MIPDRNMRIFFFSVYFMILIAKFENLYFMNTKWDDTEQIKNKIIGIAFMP